MASDGDFVTLALVRDEAGFTGNANITDAKVEEYLQAAESEVKSFIGRRYTLPLEEVPDLIEEVAKQLAAGLLLLKEYGEEAEGTTKDGKMKISWARKRLLQISRGEILLFDSSDEELSKATSIRAEAWPNDSTGTDRTTEKNDPPLFEVGQKF